VEPQVISAKKIQLTSKSSANNKRYELPTEDPKLN
jgi:hypothetical protein